MLNYFQSESEIFPANTGGGKKMANELGLPFLGSLPLDPLLARCCDEGRNYLSELPSSPTILSIKSIVASKYTFSDLLFYFEGIVKNCCR